MSSIEVNPADSLYADVLKAVVGSLAEISRHPTHLLHAHAELDDDLGITDRMFAALLVHLGQRIPTPPADQWAPHRHRTVGEVARFIMGRLDDGHAELPARDNPPRSVDDAAGGHRPLEGKVVLVTGSGRGIGRAYALRLAEHGAEIVVNSFHSRDLGQSLADSIRANGGTAHHIWASMANPAQVDRMFDEIERLCGGLDFLVNNASNGALKEMGDVTAEDMLKAYATNVVGVHMASKRAARLMTKRGGGRIINLSTTIAHIAQPHFSCMAPVKSAVEVLTRHLATELAPLSVQVICLEAGFVDGPLLDVWPDRANFIPRWEEVSPGGRLCQNEDLAEMIAFLLGPEARFANGSVLRFDGGSLAALGGAPRR